MAANAFALFIKAIDARGEAPRYNQALSRVVPTISTIKAFIFPFADSFQFVSNYIMPIVLENSTKEKRDQVREIIHEAGIQTSIHYPAVHRFAIYRDCESELPQTNYVTDNEITLPMYATLTNEQIDFILETVDRAING